LRAFTHSHRVVPACAAGDERDGDGQSEDDERAVKIASGDDPPGVAIN
jgi:hypothetical protein